MRGKERLASGLAPCLSLANWLPASLLCLRWESAFPFGPWCGALNCVGWAMGRLALPDCACACSGLLLPSCPPAWPHASPDPPPPPPRRSTPLLTSTSDTAYFVPRPPRTSKSRRFRFLSLTTSISHPSSPRRPTTLRHHSPRLSLHRILIPTLLDSHLVDTIALTPFYARLKTIGKPREPPTHHASQDFPPLPRPRFFRRRPGPRCW